MKKLFMEQEIFSWVDAFTVKNEAGEDCYQIAGDNIVIGGKKLHIRDMNGQEVGMIKQKLSLMPKFQVFIGGQQVAEIVKKFSFFKAKYAINGPGWDVKGSLLDHDYTITDGLGQIVRMHKEWFTWGDCYEMDIEDRADEKMVLAVILAIDCVMAAQEEARDDNDIN